MALKQYPKPLSEKTLKKRYAELNFSEEKTDFLKQFTLACTNLYGVISIRDIWGVYKKLAGITPVPHIHRNDILMISDVLRRDNLPYFVYEVDELNDDEPRTIFEREFVTKYLIGEGPGKLDSYFSVSNCQYSYDYYVPDNLLSYAKVTITEREKRLLEFVGKLKVTAEVYRNRLGIILMCPDRKGETLDSFSFMNEYERFNYRYVKGEYEGVKGNPEKAQRLLDEINSQSEAEKIVSNIKWYGNIGEAAPLEIIGFTLEELGEAGVVLTRQQLEELAERIMDLHNHSHLMCICGWCPADLAKQVSTPEAISFGPGIEGVPLDMEEIVMGLKDMGLECVEY